MNRIQYQEHQGQKSSATGTLDMEFLSFEFVVIGVASNHRAFFFFTIG